MLIDSVSPFLSFLGGYTVDSVGSVALGSVGRVVTGWIDAAP